MTASTKRAEPSAAPSTDAGGGPLTLAQTGAILVTSAACAEMMRDLGWRGVTEDGLETARRRLLALAADARPVDREAVPERWRSRRRSHGLDLSLNVVREPVIEGLPPIAVVVAACVRRQR